MDFTHLNNDELAIHEKAMHTRSNDAGKSLKGAESSAWARFSYEWGECKEEMRRRNIPVLLS